MSVKRGQDVLRRILLLRLNNKGMGESRRRRLANSVCANWRRLVEGANNRTRESSWFPAIPFVTKGVNVIPGCPHTRELTRIVYSCGIFGRTGPFVTQCYPTPFKRTHLCSRKSYVSRPLRAILSVSSSKLRVHI